MTGPLTGIRIVEFEGIGPAPFGAMLLGDLGAEILRIRRADAPWPDVPILTRGKSDLTLDLKVPDDQAVALEAMQNADVVIEGLRPGVMERLSLGPKDAHAVNPGLIYARMTGWGQTGPLAQRAGHDINYIAISGALAMLAPPGEAPTAPLNLLGDYAGGSLYMVVGILAALIERQQSGLGQVIDAAIIDGSASILAPILGMIAARLLHSNPAEGMLAGRAPYYRTYVCADGEAIAIGPLEPNFRRQLTDRLSIEPGGLDSDPLAASARLAALFLTRPRQDWLDMLADSDACASPVLPVADAALHPHLAERSTYVGIDSLLQPQVAPRFSRTPGAIRQRGDGDALLASWR